MSTKGAVFLSKIGLVFSGGVAKGAYQIGFCQALLERFALTDIAAISSSSIGAWNALALLTGSLDIAQDAWLNTEIYNTRTFVERIIKHRFFFDYLDAFLPADTTVSKDFFVTCCEFPLMTTHYINLRNMENGRAKEYLQAGVALPPLFTPKVVEEKTLMDGALIDNIPMQPLINEEIDILLVVHFDSATPINHALYPNTIILEINYSTAGFIKNSFDFRKDTVRTMIDCGYHYARQLLEIFFLHGLQDLDYIRASSSIYHQLRDAHGSISVDYFANRFNHIAQKFVSTNISKTKPRKTVAPLNDPETF